MTGVQTCALPIWPMSARCGSSKTGLPINQSKPIRDSAMGYGFRGQGQSGPVQEMLGLRVTEFLEPGSGDVGGGWNESERQALQVAIAARQPFLDFAFSRTNADGSTQQFRVSGEPIFSLSCAYVGYRGIGSEVTGGA